MEFLFAYHAFNRFLGTEGGELAKKAVEFILLTIVTYMIWSEWKSTKDKQLNYLRYAFFSLSIERLLMSVLLLLVVFGGYSSHILSVFAVIDGFLEIFALYLITNAFLFPLFKEGLSFGKRKLETLFIVLLFFILQMLWIVAPEESFSNSLVFFFIETIKIIILLFPLYFMVMYRSKFDRYADNIIVAFLIYLLVPIVNLFNHFFFGSTNTTLRVVTHPLPLIAILMFYKGIYQRLVDKAALRAKLTETEKKYLKTKELSKMKDEFISIVSHELRTPLTSIKLYINLLFNGKWGELRRGQKQKLKIVEEETNRLSALINDILDLTKLNANKVKLSLARVNLYEVVENCMLKAQAEKKQIKVVNNISRGFVMDVDRDRFKQVVVNLFSNALKFTEKGKITFDAHYENPSWVFSISDTGMGIPEKELPYLFDKFYQVENHMTRSKGGTGLGLAIVKHIVELHRGTIEVKSRVGEGTSFIIRIPL